MSLELLRALLLLVALRPLRIRSDLCVQEIVDARVKSRLKELLDSIFRAIQFWHRDILMCVVGADGATFHFSGEQETLERLAGRQRHSSAIRNIQAVDLALERLQSNVETQAVLEGMFIAQGRASLDPV